MFMSHLKVNVRVKKKDKLPDHITKRNESTCMKPLYNTRVNQGKH